MKVINVPVNLILATLHHKAVKPTHLRTFLYFKFCYADRFLLTDDVFNELSKVSGIHIKTIKCHFILLLKHGWLRYDPKTKRVFQMSRYRLETTKETAKVSCVCLCIQDLKNLNETILAALVAYSVKIYSHKPTKPELSKGGSLQRYVGEKRVLNGYAPIAVNYLSKMLNRSRSFVDRIKQRAIKKGYISRSHDIIETGIKWEERKYYFQSHPGSERGAQNIRGWLCCPAIDLLRSHLIIKRKKRG